MFRETLLANTTATSFETKELFTQSEGMDKQKERITFSPNGLINNVLLLQKTSLRAFIRLQYDEKSLRNESCSLRSTSTQILESF